VGCCSSSLGRLALKGQTLDEGLPSSRLFVVSQFGSPATYAKALTPAQRVSAGGTGPCAFLDPRGQIVPKELARLEGIIHQYEARLKAGCLKVSRCRYDQAAFGDSVERPQYIAPDLNHFSIKGHAQAAKVAWAVTKSPVRRCQPHNLTTTDRKRNAGAPCGAAAPLPEGLDGRSFTHDRSVPRRTVHHAAAPAPSPSTPSATGE
jgi:hypothetical protein